MPTKETEMRKGDVIRELPAESRVACSGFCDDRATKEVFIGRVRSFARPLTCTTCEACHAKSALEAATHA